MLNIAKLFMLIFCLTPQIAFAKAKNIAAYPEFIIDSAILDDANFSRPNFSRNGAFVIDRYFYPFRPSGLGMDRCYSKFYEMLWLENTKNSQLKYAIFEKPRRCNSKKIRFFEGDGEHEVFEYLEEKPDDKWHLLQFEEKEISKKIAFKLLKEAANFEYNNTVCPDGWPNSLGVIKRNVWKKENYVACSMRTTKFGLTLTKYWDIFKL